MQTFFAVSGARQTFTFNIYEQIYTSFIQLLLRFLPHCLSASPLAKGEYPNSHTCT